MPLYLRPCGPFCERAVITGDPARAMAMAQALTEQPQMANHARGLWGYHGLDPGGAELNVQATGIGGPSAVAVLADLAELGVKRALRVGGCVAPAGELGLGEVIATEDAGPEGVGVLPWLPGGDPPRGHRVWDTQTSALAEAARQLGIEFSAVLIVARTLDGGLLDDEDLTHACSAAARAGL